MKSMLLKFLLLSAPFTLLCSSVGAQIIDLKNGAEISVEDMVSRARGADMLLLGEFHDNIFHHRERGIFLKLLAQPAMTVVSEHLPVKSAVVFSGSTLSALELAGFDKNAWAWPLHEPLFDNISLAGYKLVGGNLAKGVAKDLAKNGRGNLNQAMREVVERATLNAKSAKALDQDLIDGHCGQLPEKYLAPMQLIQRATDSSFALTMIENKPAILIAGNGHVRKDYGVPQVINAIAPDIKIISIGFHERHDDVKEQLPTLNGLYDFVWFTDAASRSDPCAGFKLK
jgi:uncharacterized iron-regulated protein